MMFSGGAPLSNRNGFVDPRLDSWTTNSLALAAGGAYSAAPMWLAGCGTGGAGTSGWTDVRTNASVQAISDASTRFAFTHAQSAPSSGTVAARTAPFTLLQRIEDVTKYAGKSVTLSYKLWTGGASITIPSILLQQNFGTGGSPSAANNFDKAVNWTLTATPQRFSVRVDVPAITGKTIGTTGGDYLAVGLWLPPGVAFTLVGIEPQIELCSPNSSTDINGAGGSPTSFEWRGEQAELARVQRHYETGPWHVLGWSSGVNQWIGGLSKYVVTKRAAPTVSTATTGGTFATFSAATTVGVDALFVQAFSSGANAAVELYGTFTADARL